MTTTVSFGNSAEKLRNMQQTENIWPESFIWHKPFSSTSGERKTERRVWCLRTIRTLKRIQIFTFTVVQNLAIISDYLSFSFAMVWNRTWIQWCVRCFIKQNHFQNRKGKTLTAWFVYSSPWQLCTDSRRMKGLTPFSSCLQVMISFTTTSVWNTMIDVIIL